MQVGGGFWLEGLIRVSADAMAARIKVPRLKTSASITILTLAGKYKQRRRTKSRSSTRSNSSGARPHWWWRKQLQHDADKWPGHSNVGQVHGQLAHHLTEQEAE